ncbi:MAG: hypothetical protein PHV34_13535 [Verrucomicrobiae bacterium]|nr:hypothetical protein [Verrucomicrobiae bacterium]
MMTLLTRIFLGITIVAVLAGGYFGMKLKTHRDDTVSQLKATKNTLDQTQNTLKSTENNLKKTTSDLKETTSRLETASAELENKKKSLENEKSEKAKVEAKLKAANNQCASLEAEVGRYKNAMPPGLSPEQVKGKFKEMTDQTATLEQEKKVLQEQLTKLDAEKKQLEDLARARRDGKPPVGVSGKVVAVNPEWNFVVIDIGSKQGVIENVPMIVYRGSKLVGKVKISSVEPSVSIADVLDEWKQEDIQEGDTVIF